MARRSFENVTENLEMVDDLLTAAASELPAGSPAKSPLTTAQIILARMVAKVSGKGKPVPTEATAT